MDFTLEKFHELIKAVIVNSYNIIPFHLITHTKSDKILILRHDVDKMPKML